MGICPGVHVAPPAMRGQILSPCSSQLGNLKDLQGGGFLPRVVIWPGVDVGQGTLRGKTLPLAQFYRWRVSIPGYGSMRPPLGLSARIQAASFCLATRRFTFFVFGIGSCVGPPVFSRLDPTADSEPYPGSDARRQGN